MLGAAHMEPMENNESREPVKVLHGYVNAREASFSTDRDGRVRYSPLFPQEMPIYLTDELGDGPNHFRLPIYDGEFFQVLEDTDKSEGRGPRSAAGNYLEYVDARIASRGKGAQGGAGYVELMTPAVKVVTAIDGEGNEVVMGETKVWSSRSLYSRMEFPNR